MSGEDLPKTSISDLELQLSALVIAHAILNPSDVTQWDGDWFADPMRGVKAKYYKPPMGAYLGPCHGP
ncbi:hypothetical protein M404DRAFT_23270 [Pisolithus tinctorius Marx 270]|uniref:Uncharacterized protein n=1 Tax=Pisolithus tinctorius Marx 270 TaxID=870435 RepID=A0A0C3PIS6_PISTI|nr:hypothetical protein M404DRAFT_23270 [Pisolithus tinctorius Marx 270]